MRVFSTYLQNHDVRRPATLTLPDGEPRLGLVALHPADNPSRHQPLFEHLSTILSPEGVAVLRYDRRPRVGWDDVPFQDQASDALAGIRLFRGRKDGRSIPIGIWGYSQGAWAAAVAALDSKGPDFLVLLACSGVSPAEQMRYGTVEHLRRAHFGARSIRELLGLRTAFEEALRNPSARRPALQLITEYRNRPWFPLSWVPSVLPRTAHWRDMDFDPCPVLSAITCPVLLFYGEQDAWTPIARSIRVWRAAVRSSHNPAVRVVRLPGTGHGPFLERGPRKGSISPRYTDTLRSWVRSRARRGVSSQSIQR